MNAQMMMVLTEAISKGARPFFTKEGQDLICEYVNSGKVVEDNADEVKAGA
jgi:hypothetical protein